MNHAMLISAGQNWHLFDTIDVKKHATEAAPNSIGSSCFSRRR